VLGGTSPVAAGLLASVAAAVLATAWRPARGQVSP